MKSPLGVIFRDILRISPAGIEWKGKCWPLDSITRVRWGGTRHIVNGVLTSTTYSVIFGNSSHYEHIELKREEVIYFNFIDRLWKAIGVRMLTEYLKGLRNGEKYQFSSAIISDYGVYIARIKFIMDERIFCRWRELTIWNESGAFCIGKKGDKTITAIFDYQNDDNIHILETAIRTLFKRGGNKLSSILGK